MKIKLEVWSKELLKDDFLGVCWVTREHMEGGAETWFVRDARNTIQHMLHKPHTILGFTAWQYVNVCCC